MSNSVQPHRWQPTRLCCPWDSPGKNTGVGCHFVLQCMKVKIKSEVAQLCLTLHDRMDWSLPVSSVHGIFQARVLEWVAIAWNVLAWIFQARVLEWVVPCHGISGKLQKKKKKEFTRWPFGMWSKAIYFLIENAQCVKELLSCYQSLVVLSDHEKKIMKVKVVQLCLTLWDPIQSMEFSRPEYWSG